MDNLIVRALKNNFTAKRATHQTADSFSDPYGGVFSFLNGLSSSAAKVNHETALSLSAVFNAVDQISNDIAKLPKAVFEKKGNERNRRSDHPVDYLISKRPNAHMSQFNFHKALIVHALLRGNGIAVINRNEYTGAQESFDLIKPEDVRGIKKYQGELFYDINEYGNLSSEDVIHIPGFSFNGITGISVFRYAAQNLGAAMAAETFADENFKSKGLLAGIITTEKTGISVGAKKKVADAMETRLSAGGTHNIGFLDEGMKFQSITANAQEASLIDWKKISVEDVARWFNIAPHKIKHLADATYSNIEQQSLEHGGDTIMPWAKRVEEEYDYKCFSPTERLTYYTKLNTNALIRTDIKTKSDYYFKSIMGGWHTQNEVRALEEINAIDGHDVLLTPSNALTPEQIEKITKDGKE